ncbi:hypothetical protein N7509_000266 [Penicillium cosmopolitanum]|uniref:Uncharacterized protein n=1 Tax=Penicillium cosmopolitanum TaxID=1131564 RepID=A0A9W9WAN1_9EURO|nr:uncharacterized protein N7509_000266 [Penicillium cosmopolitanum]KAJ5413639.1 hypothetical protein N7509_000266 [Penicillium cosmopolitanum]
MSPYKAIIFDMGDVLFRWEPKINTTLTTDTLRAIANSDLWAHYEAGGMTSTQCYKQLGEEHGVSPEEIASTFRQSTGCLTPDAGMTGFLHELKDRGLPIYMMTNIPQLDYDRLRLMEYDWHIFDQIFASGYVGMRKPDLKFYEHVLAEIGVGATEAIFVDDKRGNVAAAREVGITGLVFQSSKAEDVRGHIRKLLAGGPAAIGA